MKRKRTTCSTVVELGPRAKVPRKGLAMRGAIVYEDGREIGVVSSTPTSAGEQHVIDARGDFVVVWYVPTGEALREATA